MQTQKRHLLLWLHWYFTKNFFIIFVINGIHTNARACTRSQLSFFCFLIFTVWLLFVRLWKHSEKDECEWDIWRRTACGFKTHMLVIQNIFTIFHDALFGLEICNSKHLFLKMFPGRRVWTGEIIAHDFAFEKYTCKLNKAVDWCNVGIGAKQWIQITL